ncbi:DUF4328 domain-containing protein [Streptomyces sp. cg35]|uniref:DUF4328 domain-containing protein n=1 Tax=Streptomyces sp. cg35 TaxID=3421650 RepID=UPI003D1870EC
MLCKRCGKNNALVEDGLCARCADEAFGTLTAAPGPDPVPDEPGPPRPVPGPGWGVPLSPNGLAAAVTVLLGVVIAADLFAVVTGVLEYRFAADLLADGWKGRSEADLDRLDDLYALAGAAQLFTYVAAGIAFVVWFSRVRHNGEVFAPDGHSKARPWVLFGFVVPIANLWFPRRIALDIAQASAVEGRGVRRQIECWWFLWLANQTVTWFMEAWYESAERLPDIKDATGAVVLADLLDIVSAVFAIAFVRALTGLQNRKVAHAHA